MKSKGIVDRIDDFVNCLPKEYDRPARKFIRLLLGGLVAARSTVLAEVARAVCSSAGDFSATYKKLYRRLSEVDLRAAMEQLQARALRELTDEHIIALDIGDLAKPESETLEGLQLVADGSRDHRPTPGYWPIGAVAVNVW